MSYVYWGCRTSKNWEQQNVRRQNSHSKTKRHRTSILWRHATVTSFNRDVTACLFSYWSKCLLCDESAGCKEYRVDELWMQSEQRLEAQGPGTTARNVEGKHGLKYCWFKGKCFNPTARGRPAPNLARTWPIRGEKWRKQEGSKVNVNTTWGQERKRDFCFFFTMPIDAQWMNYSTLAEEGGKNSKESTFCLWQRQDKSDLISNDPTQSIKAKLKVLT